MRLLLLVTSLLVTTVLVSGDNGCPSFCECDTIGTSGIFAKCNSFSPKEEFGMDIAALDLSNIPESSELVLTSRIFLNAGLRRVSSIKIVNSALKKIDVNAFQGLHNLYSLNLTGNHLSLLAPDMFANNTHLEKLSLSHNPLQNMQADPSPYKGYFLNIPSLQELDLSYCGLSHLLSTMFTKLTTVVYINLAANGITYIPDETFAPLIDLEEVDLSNNALTFLNSELFQHNIEMTVLNLRNNPISTLAHISMPDLQRLDVSQCDFATIDNSTFSGFSHLRNLNLSGNDIITLDQNSFSGLKKLQYLDLSDNNLIGELPDDVFINNPDLETIRLKNNPQMEKLPDTGFLGEFNELYLLDASNCGITHLESQALKRMTRLSYLNLSGNKIQYLSPGFLSPRIVHLDLTGNKITNLDQVFFAPNSWLRKLYLSGNPLTTLSPNNFDNTPRLTKLYLKSCNLKKLWDLSDDGLEPLKSLIYLNVANNQIDNITVNDLLYIPRVQTLVLTGNPLPCIDNVKIAINSLFENGVASSDSTEKKQLDEIKLLTRGSDHPTALEIDREGLGWNSILKHICNEKLNLESDPSYTPYFETTNNEKTTGTDEGRETNSATEFWETETWEMPDSFGDEIQKLPVQESRSGYMWPIIIVSMSAFAIILALVWLAAFLLKWNREKNSYRKTKNIKRHPICNTPKEKRSSSTVYQQLYEEANTPTTPVMTNKFKEENGEHRTYKFPDTNTSDSNNSTAAQPNTNSAYLISPFHHSNIVPESV